jgi:hypothetical protein
MTTEKGSASQNGLATVSLILGILALPLSVLLSGNFIAVLLGIAAVITGVIALKQVKTHGSKGKGLALAGIILGSLSIVWAILFVLVIGPAISGVFSSIEDALGAP